MYPKRTDKSPKTPELLKFVPKPTPKRSSKSKLLPKSLRKPQEGIMAKK